MVLKERLTPGFHAFHSKMSGLGLIRSSSPTSVLSDCVSFSLLPSDPRAPIEEAEARSPPATPNAWTEKIQKN